MAISFGSRRGGVSRVNILPTFHCFYLGGWELGSGLLLSGVVLRVDLLSYVLRSVVVRTVWIFTAGRCSDSVERCCLGGYETGACSFIRFAELSVLPTTTAVLVLLCLWSGIISFQALSSLGQISLIGSSRLHQAWSASVGPLRPRACASGVLFV